MGSRGTGRPGPGAGEGSERGTADRGGQGALDSRFRGNDYGNSPTVTPANAGVQSGHEPRTRPALDSRFRGNDYGNSPTVTLANAGVQSGHGPRSARPCHSRWPGNDRGLRSLPRE